MSWNYRVVRKRFTHLDGTIEHCYYVHSAYYKDGEDVPRAISREPMSPYGGTIGELESDLRMMQEALKKQVLAYEDF